MPCAVAPAGLEAHPRGPARGGHRGRRRKDASPPQPGRMRACGSPVAAHSPGLPSIRWFPDAGFTEQEQGTRAGRERVQEAMKDRELGLAPDDVTGQRRSPRVGGPKDCRDGGSPCRPSRPGAVCRACTKCVPGQPSGGGPGVSPFPLGHQDDLRFLQVAGQRLAPVVLCKQGWAVRVRSSPRMTPQAAGPAWRCGVGPGGLQEVVSPRRARRTPADRRGLTREAAPRFGFRPSLLHLRRRKHNVFECSIGRHAERRPDAASTSAP